VIGLLDRRAPAASGDRVNLAISAGGELITEGAKRLVAHLRQKGRDELL